MKSHFAVAVDLGASSVRYALGSLVEGRIGFTIQRQLLHEPYLDRGRLCWNYPQLLSFVQEAAEFARSKGASLSIDGWGVDHALVDRSGELVQPVVCYRDASHENAFRSMQSCQSAVYRETGIQNQPFNTLYQLAARREEDPTLLDRTRWVILPRFLLGQLGAEPGCDVTQASTTQLMGSNLEWSSMAFDLCGWPIPDNPPEIGLTTLSGLDGVTLVVGSEHDSAAAAIGLGAAGLSEAFLNLGTWSIIGAPLTRAVISPESEAANFSNERAYDGSVRFLRNVPGFYVFNRLREELGLACGLAEWLDNASEDSGHVDLFDADFFRPDSMVQTMAAKLGRMPGTHADFAQIAMNSLCRALGASLSELQSITGLKVETLRVGGGGSQVPVLMQQLADTCRVNVAIGSPEATLLGNLATQFLARGLFSNPDEMRVAVLGSTREKLFLPGGSSCASN